MKSLFYKKSRIITISLLLFLLFIFFWTDTTIHQIGTVKIWDRNNILLYESAGTIGKKIPITYDKLPKHLINAAIASEDNTFWTNPGIDIQAIIRSLLLNIQHKQILSGASTITQQLSRAAVISPGAIPSRNVLRKMQEILIALRLTMIYSKKDMLTLYFSTMYFGNLSYGIQAAAHTYFDKDSSQLSLAESAFLVGLLSNPDARNPYTNMQTARTRQAHVLDVMVKQKFIKQSDADDAKKEQLALATKKSNIKAPHFVHYALEELERLGLNSKLHAGLNVYTTLDFPTERLSEDIAKLWIDKLHNDHDVSNAAVVLLNNQTGEIISMLGGIDYFDATHAGQVNMTTALRQPGSAIKPVTYATAFMQGYTPATLIYDVKKVYQTKTGEGFTPNNYDGRFHGLVLTREALASSLNLPAVEMLQRVGIPNFLKTARALGITTLTEKNRYDVSLTLGGGEVTLLDLTNVFASFSRGGRYKEAYAITNITTDSGSVVYQHKSDQSIPALGKNSKHVAYLLSNILSDPKARISGFGEKNPLVLSHPAAVKTGTTTDWHDNWTIGYTPSYTVGVWVGNNDNHAMRDITGVTGAAPIWNQFFEEFLKGKPVEQFIKPDHIKTVEICALSGKLLDGLCPDKKTEFFIEGTEPKEHSHLHKQVTIDNRNNLLADPSCPSQFTHKQIFIDYPPEVYTWAVQNNQPVIPRDYSPLCTGKQTNSEPSFLSIIYPKDRTVFESAPLMIPNQTAVFEVNVSQDVEKVSWYVDSTLVKTTTTFPFSTPWAIKLGKYTISATGYTSNGESIQTHPVHISVVEYQSDN